MRGPSLPVAEIRKEFRFEAAHSLPRLPAGHKCRGVHGHSFRVTLVVRGPIDPHYGWVMDFAELKAAFEPLEKRLDHANLNEVEGLENPTAENLAVWVWRRVETGLPHLAEVHVSETCTASVVYRGASERSAS